MFGRQTIIIEGDDGYIFVFGWQTIIIEDDDVPTRAMEGQGKALDALVVPPLLLLLLLLLLL